MLANWLTADGYGCLAEGVVERAAESATERALERVGEGAVERAGELNDVTLRVVVVVLVVVLSCATAVRGWRRQE